ncbi:TetR/AcrR family transcriptional regulator [Novosphingobium sp. SL115]|uniref:TetR/AcrR family transcriptional regulator n=1 Tax=Novosphingobium sp. SL115 TaxID=2995150 RepID=UPI002273CD32|nr:TetR/AcrR family transcriptional regulator [Novosphingobium sp. SL115]MCY1672793.1 TetR/AcrR family transcriptional regulator [Novosphingobium sp. SL115]
MTVTMKPPAPTPAAMNKGQRTASRILDVAEALFAQHGYGATSLRDIAAQAGLQQPGLYKHFSGKDDLYRQVYERALKPMTDLMDAILAGPDDRFDELTDRMTDLLAQHPNIAKLLVRAAISSDAQADPVALDWLGRLVGYGRKLSDKAGVPSSDDILAVQIVAIFNMLFGFFWASPLIENLSGKPATDRPLMDMQKGLLRSFIGGMGQSGGQAPLE